MLKRIVAIDLETTGLNPYKGAKILEIGGIVIKNLNLVEDELFHSFVNPGVSIPPKITRLNGITDEMVKNARDISEVLPEFFDFLGDSPIIAHNAEFDIKFINYFSMKLGRGSIKNKVIDTLYLSREAFPYEKTHNLDKLLEKLEIPYQKQKRHRSIEDATLTAKAFIKLVNLSKKL